MMTTYLITGASRGMGRALALELMRDAGVRVLGVARNKVALRKLEELAGSETYPGVFIAGNFDLTELDEDIFQDWLRPYLPLTGLVNNAGLLINEPFDSMDERKWKEIFEINLFTPVKLCKLLQNSFVRGGHIVNIGSMGGFQGSSKYNGLAAYSASKAALTGFSECLAEEWRNKGVGVNCLAMGAVQTEMLETAFPGYEAPINDEEAADFLKWFLTKGKRFFNGKVLPVALQNP
ncbi:short-chain dehydrogenase [Lewinellaceae bacterium SD302]|nr:short-chain dehydrogenase [Lewinellaceae bacterium SD302]